MQGAAGHLDGERLTDAVDRSLAEDGADTRHLADCFACQQRVSELRGVVQLLSGLPPLEPPRDLVLAPPAVAAPAPRPLFIERAYRATRLAAVAFAALFVVLLGATLYVPGQPLLNSQAPTASTLSAPAPVSRAAQSASPVVAQGAAAAAPVSSGGQQAASLPTRTPSSTVTSPPANSLDWLRFALVGAGLFLILSVILAIGFYFWLRRRSLQEV